MSTVLNVSDADKAKLTVREKNGRVSFSEDSYIRTSTGIETYAGDYEIDPIFSEQVLNTQYKIMSNDMTVNAIYVARTTNLQGGNTVYIGGEFING